MINWSLWKPSPFDHLQIYVSCPWLRTPLYHPVLILARLTEVTGLVVNIRQWSVCVCVSDIAIDWSDHGLWWPDKNIWLARTRSTLDQYGVQADAKLWFTPMHKNLRITLPDLQVLDMPVNFSTNVFSNVIRICRELGKFIMFIRRIQLTTLICCVT